MSDNSLNISLEVIANEGLVDNKIRKFPAWVESTFDVFIALILFAELIVLFGNVAMRQLFNVSFDGANEVATLALMVLAFVGGAVAYHRGEHVSIRFLVDKFPLKWRDFFDAFSVWIVMGLAIVGLVIDWPTIGRHWKIPSAVLGIPNGVSFIPFAVGAFLLIIFTIKRMLQYKLRTVLPSFATVLVLFAVWYYVQSITGPWTGVEGFAFVGILLFAMVFLGVPIAFVLNLVTYLFIKSANLAQITAVPPAMMSGISGFILLAVPFFILAGHIMTEGGLTKPLADWVSSLIGHVRAGLLHVLVVSMFIFSGISGSKLADVAAVGTAMRDMLKEKGYDRSEFTAVLAASAVMGETIPPSIPMLVLGSITALSVGGLFIAGLVPAVLMALCLMIFIFFKGRAKQWPKGEKQSWLDRTKITVKAIPVLLVPTILIVGIVGGIATPTEASSFAVIYAILVGTLLYKSVKLRDLVKVFANSGIAGGMILYIISTGASLSWGLTVANLPHYISLLLNALGGTSTVFLIFSLVLLIVMGQVLEGTPALLIFAPMLIPLSAHYGINGTHFGILMIFAMGLGSFLPPVGMCFFVTCSVGESTMEEVFPKYIQYVIVLLVGLLLVTFIPAITLWLPKLLHIM